MRPLALVFALAAAGCATWTSDTRKAGSGPAQRSDLLAIADLEDRRALGEGRLMTAAVTDREPLVRERAQVALGRLQEPTTAGAITEGLTDPEAKVRSAAAFASGLLGLSWAPLPDEVRTRLTTSLLTAEAAETDSSTRAAMLEALGRIATSGAVERLTERLSHAETSFRAMAGLALGLAAKNKATLPPKTISALAAMAGPQQGLEVRRGATYGLMQSKSPQAKAALLAGLRDENAELRGWSAKGLREIGADADTASVRPLLDDPDFRVAVEATLTLAKWSAGCGKGPCQAAGALGDLNLRVERVLRGDTAGGGQPLLALGQSAVGPAARASVVALRNQLSAGKSINDQRIKQDVAKLECRLAGVIDGFDGRLNEVMNCGFGLVDEPRRLQIGLERLEAAARSRTLDAPKLLAEIGAYTFHADPKVKLAAISLVGALKVPAGSERLRPHLASADLIIAAAAATASAELNDTGAIAAIRQLGQRAAASVDVVPLVAAALASLKAMDAVPELEKWLTSPEASIRIAAAEALTTLKKAPIDVPRVERPQGGARVTPPRKGATLLIVTEKGELEVTLFTDDAPLTSANLLTLATKGFFRGLSFHRVVPGFVAQGGDPRGDGNGGPGYAIRCEVNRRPYVRGTVGMALSGKDTGGSQFFIATSSQPHLDGRYTVFGEVTRGLELVDTLLEDDRIIDVRVK